MENLKNYKFWENHTPEDLKYLADILRDNGCAVEENQSQYEIPAYKYLLVKINGKAAKIRIYRGKFLSTRDAYDLG